MSDDKSTPLQQAWFDTWHNLYSIKSECNNHRDDITYDHIYELADAALGRLAELADLFPQSSTTPTRTPNR